MDVVDPEAVLELVLSFGNPEVAHRPAVGLDHKHRLVGRGPSAWEELFHIVGRLVACPIHRRAPVQDHLLGIALPGPRKPMLELVLTDRSQRDAHGGRLLLPRRISSPHPDHKRVRHARQPDASATADSRPEATAWASVRECHPTLNYAFDDGAESVLRSECPFDSLDDVQAPDHPGHLENPFDDRRGPQHDVELAIALKGVFLRLQEHADDRGVDEVGA